MSTKDLDQAALFNSERRNADDHARPPAWALRLAREMFREAYGKPLENAVARAIADAVDAARVEAADECGETCSCEGRILALRHKEPRRD